MSKKRELFEVKDPQGRVIRLATSTWNRHIIIRHPEMKGHRQKVQKTVVDPNVLIESSKGDYSLIYSNNELIFSNLYVHVVVGFDDKYKEGNVRTSYLSPNLPKGKTIWIRKKY